MRGIKRIKTTTEVNVSENDFSQYKKLFEGNFKDIDDRLKKIEEGQEKLHDDVLMLKFKSGIWGFVAGAIPTIATIIIILITYLINK